MADNVQGDTPESLAYTSPDMVMKQVLDRIASGESPDYTTIYGGHKFTSFDDHPRIPIPIAEKPGWHSDAAGRYQFLSSTWDKEREKLGLKDFSPASQDKAAWDLASSVYLKGTGRELLDDATKGTVDWSSLAGTWPSLEKKGVAAAKGEAKPSAGYVNAGGKVVQPAALTSSWVPPPALPPAKAKGNFDSLLPLLTLAHPNIKFTPVSYDPFKIQEVAKNG